MKPISFAFLAAALAVSPICSPQAQELAVSNIDSIVAVVNEDVILRSELDLAVANISRQFSSSDQAGQLPSQEILERQVLDRLILMRLQVDRASESGIRISDQELQEATSSIASQNRMSVDELRQRLAADNLSFGEFQSNLRDEVTVQRLRQSYVQSSVQISEAEIDQVLATSQVGGAEVRLANIQISLAEGATPDEIANAKTKIDEIKSMIERGEIDFRSAAIRYSQAQNALDGGEIGWRTFDAVPPVFINVLKGMVPGQITDVVRGASGFQIVQLEEIREPQPQKVTQYKAQDIMVAVTDLVSAETARQKIDALRERIVAGAEFGSVAKEASDDAQTRAQGGDMGWFQADAWGNAVAKLIQQLADGELSAVFQSEVGFHLIKRIGQREQDVTEENRRNKAREVVGQRKAEEVFERFLRQIRAEAYVDSRLGGA